MPGIWNLLEKMFGLNANNEIISANMALKEPILQNLNGGFSNNTLYYITPKDVYDRKGFELSYLEDLYEKYKDYSFYIDCPNFLSIWDSIKPVVLRSIKFLAKKSFYTYTVSILMALQIFKRFLNNNTQRRN